MKLGSFCFFIALNSVASQGIDPCPYGYKLNPVTLDCDFVSCSLYEIYNPVTRDCDPYIPTCGFDEIYNPITNECDERSTSPTTSTTTTCSFDEILNPLTNECDLICDFGYTFNDLTLDCDFVVCNFNEIYNPLTRECDLDIPTCGFDEIYNPITNECDERSTTPTTSTTTTCSFDEILNPFTNECEILPTCDFDEFYNPITNECDELATCGSGFTLNAVINTCVCNNDDFDLLTILVDGSKSLDNDNFQKTIDLVESLINTLDLSSSKISIAQFSYQYKEYLSFSNSKSKINKALEMLRNDYMNHGTYMANALEEVYKNFQAQPNTSNEDKYLIVFSDGEATEPFNMVVSQADRLKASGVTIATVGVGKAVTSETWIAQLLEIASDVDDMFTAENFDDLESILLEDLSDHLCDLGEPTTIIPVDPKVDSPESSSSSVSLTVSKLMYVFVAIWSILYLRV